MSIPAINPLEGGSTAKGFGVTAVLGPTNTGKTHLAIERMAAHKSGLIGLPLRLLAREVYERLCQKVGVAKVALITGEEKIQPENAPYKVCTVEAMPSQTDAAFVAIDEVQLAVDLERGHIFTDRILHLRGREETLLLGAQTVEQLLRNLLPGLEVISRPRLSVLDYAGSKKITRIPARSAIVAFSANEVYAIAELIKRQRGGAAVVLGSLSPRTRNAQVALYQAGEVDFLVATDAIGMGLNLDLHHVAFAQDKKFDGFQHRRLTAAEMGQIAGRAGRHTKDGTFGVTGHVQPLEEELIEQLITHQFQPQKVLSWRNRNLDFSSVANLQDSLETPSSNRLLMKSPPSTDRIALDTLSRNPLIIDSTHNSDEIQLLWDICLIPDYRKISPSSHAELLTDIYSQIIQTGYVDDDWFAKQVKRSSQLSSEIDALSSKIAHIRTWTYLSHRSDWLKNAEYWQEKTREIEDKLSDALHEALTKRFIDRRTSLLMKKLREKTHMNAEVKTDGEIIVEGHSVGRLSGFRFTPDTSGETPEAKAASNAAQQALAEEIEKRANRLAACPNSDIVMSKDATLRWLGEPVAKLVAGENALKPKVLLLADEQLTGPSRDSVSNRIERWLANHIANILKPLVEMSADQTLDGMARGVAFQIVEALGNIDRRKIANDVQALDQDMRAGLRRHGVRFGAYTIFVPTLLKPAPAELLCNLWQISNEKPQAPGMDEIPTILASGRTSTVYNAEYEDEAYRLCGYRILGQKAVRIDILERLADLIRPAMFWKPEGDEVKPEGAINGRNFFVTPAMLSILGATHDDMEVVLKGLGYRNEQKLESEIIPQSDEKPSSPEETKTSSDESEDESKTPVDKTIDTDAPAAEEIPVSTDANGEVAIPVDGPKMINVWRLGAGNKKQTQHQPRKDENRFRRPHKGKPRSSKDENKNPKKNFSKQSAKPAKLDPDSPFAKLAVLKESLKSGE